MNLSTLTTGINTIQQRIADFGKPAHQLEFERMMKQIAAIMKMENANTLIADIEHVINGITEVAALHPNSIYRRMLAEQVQVWALHGYTVEQIKLMLPAFVDGIRQAREYGV